jgi:cytochrome c biogenesis protein CcmG/thiol:disulfide interchange protein DsbE
MDRPLAAYSGPPAGGRLSRSGAEAIFILCRMPLHKSLAVMSCFQRIGSSRRALHVALAAAFLVLARPVRAQDEGIALGAVAPSVVVTSVTGGPVTVTPTLGRPMLIEFWATWCEFCERLEPTMKSVYGKYGSRVQFAAIAVNVNQSPRRVAKHVKDRSLLYPVYYDASGKATRVYDVPATSFVVIIDKKGKVAYTGVGDKQDLDAAIRRVL